MVYTVTVYDIYGKEYWDLVPPPGYEFTGDFTPCGADKVHLTRDGKPGRFVSVLPALILRETTPSSPGKLNFQCALTLLKDGARVGRASWPNVYLKKADTAIYMYHPGYVNSAPYQTLYRPSTEDLLAEDWYHVQ